MSELKAGDLGTRRSARRPKWSPQITVGTPVLIPEDYVGICRCAWRSIGGSPRSRTIASQGLAAELVDRFGPLPPEVE